MNDAYIIGVSQFNTKKLCDVSPPQTTLSLSSFLLDEALKDASLELSRNDIDGLFSSRPLYFTDDSIKDSPKKYMYPSWLSSKLDLNKENKSFITKTCECGGATPVSMCLNAKDLIKNNNSNCIAIIIVHTPNSQTRDKFKNNGSQRYKLNINEIKDKNDGNINNDPAIATLYGCHTKSFLNKYGKKYGIKRKHLAMIPCLMYRNGYKHPQSLSYKNNKLLNSNINDIINSNKITKYECLKQFECARLCDGGICIIISSKKFILKNKNKSIDINRCFKIKSGGEYVNNFFLKPHLNDKYQNYSIFHAVNKCLNNSNINNVNDIDWFGLYDCYPITFLFGLISSGIVKIENVASFLEEWYYNNNTNNININTHGGLLGFGAPSFVPAGFMIIEAIKQLRNEVKNDRQIKLKNNKTLKSLIIGNGGVFHHSSAMLIEKHNKNILTKL